MKIDWLFGDDDIELTEQEAHAVFVIMGSRDTNLVKVVRDAGFDPSLFFEEGKWSGVDFRDTDVKGVSFRLADLSGAILYRDQLESIRKTGPRTLDKAKVQETRSGGKGEVFTLFLDQPRDPSVARDEFRSIIEDVAIDSQNTKNGKIDWDKATRYVARLDKPLGRVQALDIVLDRFDAMPGRNFANACLVGFNLDAVVSSVGWSSGVEFLRVMHLQSDEARVEFLRDRLAEGAVVDERVIFKIFDLGSTIDLLRSVVDVYTSFDLRLSASAFGYAQGKLARSIEGTREILRQMQRSSVDTDAHFFRTVASSVRKTEEIAEVLALMKQAGVQPDPTTFSKMAQQAKSIQGVREFLSLMDDAAVRPDQAVFAVMAQQATSIDGVREFLTLMTDAGVRPDPAVFAVMAKEAKTIDGVREFLTLMTDAEASPDHRHLSAFIEACSSLDEANEFLNQLEEFGKNPSNKQLNVLLNNVGDHIEAEKVWALFARFNLAPDHITWGVLVKKMPDWPSAWEAYTSRRPEKAVSTGAVLNPILFKARNSEQLKMTLQEFERRRVELDTHSLRALLGANLSDIDVVWALGWMQKRGLDLSAVDLAQLGDSANRFAVLKDSL